MNVFKRKIYSKMLDWKLQTKGSRALLIEGPRRVGKSTISLEFAKNEYEDFLLIDFTKASKDIIDLFENFHDIQLFFLSLQALTGKSLPPRRSVIIFDEIQFCPKARQAIKHLVADGRYDYIETGSLISIRKNTKDILIPSEERRLEMNPMDFEEFLWAMDKKAMYDTIRISYDNAISPGDAVVRSIMREFRLYMLVGGMPQSVSKYVEGADFSEIDMVKRDIIDLYLEDFRKLDEKGRASSIFSSIPSELSRNTVQYRVGNVLESGRPSRLGEIFSDLAESKTVNFSYHANDPNVGLAIHADLDRFRMYICDTGLFVTLAYRDKDFTDNIIYQKLLSDKLATDLGYVYENVVAQLLKSAGHKLYYYTFRIEDADSSKFKSYEIDFLISEKNKICPIEVKSSGYNTFKSLEKFSSKYSSRIGTPYILHTKGMKKFGIFQALPVYMVGLL